MEKLLNQLVERLKKAYGERLKSVILYGSAAVGDHNSKFSDLNVLSVLENVTPRELAESESIVHWWREKGNPSPLLLTSEELRRGADCFPMEFYDIRERRRVLYGEDVAASLEIDPRYYRALVEHELRAKVLRLRTKAAGMLHDPELLQRLLADSVSTFCVLFRHALVLAGDEARFGKREIVEQARERFGVDPAPFLKLLDLREEKIKPKEVAPTPLLGEYLEQIQNVIRAVDALER
jgi:predicted nucleotidyltransferase